MELLPTFADTLTRQRLAAGMSQSDLAEQAAVSISYLRKLEQGTTEPSGITVCRSLSAALDIDPRILLGYGYPGRAREVLLTSLHDAPTLLVDHQLRVLTLNDGSKSICHGLSAGDSFPAWLFNDPHARLIIEDWRLVARSIAWWITSLNGPHSSAIESIKTSREFQRLANAPFTTTDRNRLMNYDGLALRSWQTRRVNRFTLALFSGTTDAATLIYLLPSDDSTD